MQTVFKTRIFVLKILKIKFFLFGGIISKFKNKSILKIQKH